MIKPSHTKKRSNKRNRSKRTNKTSQRGGLRRSQIAAFRKPIKRTSKEKKDKDINNQELMMAAAQNNIRGFSGMHTTLKGRMRAANQTKLNEGHNITHGDTKANAYMRKLFKRENEIHQNKVKEMQRRRLEMNFGKKNEKKSRKAYELNSKGNGETSADFYKRYNQNMNKNRTRKHGYDYNREGHKINNKEYNELVSFKNTKL
jgi:hypothetical protein